MGPAAAQQRTKWVTPARCTLATASATPRASRIRSGALSRPGAIAAMCSLSDPSHSCMAKKSAAGGEEGIVDTEQTTPRGRTLSASCIVRRVVTTAQAQYSSRLVNAGRSRDECGQPQTQAEERQKSSNRAWRAFAAPVLAVEVRHERARLVQAPGDLVLALAQVPPLLHLCGGEDCFATANSRAGVTADSITTRG